MPILRYRLKDQEYCVPVKDRASIGRLEDNDLCVPHESISRHHALITRDLEQYQVVDQQSANGIRHGGRRVTSLPLAEGTSFALGQIEFTFWLQDSPPEGRTQPPGRAEAAAAPALEAGLPPGAPAAAPDGGASTRAEANLLTPKTEPAPTPPGPATGAEQEADLAAVQQATAQLRAAKEKILEQISKVIVGQKEVLDQILVALFARGHCLLIGVPGLAKTLMVKVLAGTVNLAASRIQFTPDLMPSDITGTDILETDALTGKRNFRFHQGPLFANLLLADEINRTPPKTQAALLEAMQEHKVTISGTTYPLPEPFMVLATQNPIEQEGTYPLPEAQLDRFMFCVLMTYPNANDEQRVLLETTREAMGQVSQVLGAEDILRLQRLVRQVPVSQHVASYALSLVRATRPGSDGVLEFVNRWVRWGAGTRAGQYLLLAAKAHVLLAGRFSVSCPDVRKYALPVLRHRIFTNFTAASEGVNTDQIVKKVMESVKEPVY